jgi:hypothetical protein
LKRSTLAPCNLWIGHNSSIIHQFIEVLRPADDELAVPMKTTLLLKYFLWSMLLFALSVGFMSFGALRSLELKSLDLAAVARSRWQSRAPENTEMPAAPLPIWGFISDEAYLQGARRIVHHLKNIGAAVVVVPLPEDLLAIPSNLSLLDAIKSDSIAVFSSGIRTRSRFSIRTPLMFEERRARWARQPTFHRLEIPWGVSSVLTDSYGILYRIAPDAYKDFDTGNPVPDVALQAVKRYVGYPDSLEIRTSHSFVSFGAYTIPLEKDGLAYVKGLSFPRYRGGVYASALPETDSLSYFPMAWSGTPREKNLDAAWEYYKGKIAILDWSGLSQLSYANYSWTYAQIISAILGGNYVKRYNDYDLLLIIFTVVLLSVLSYNLRGLLTLGISLLLGLGVLVLSIWLYDQYSVLFDPLYVLVPLVLCGIILPVVKLAEEKRMAEELAASHEEEKKRLEELVRNLSTRL